MPTLKPGDRVTGLNDTVPMIVRYKERDLCFCSNELSPSDDPTLFRASDLRRAPKLATVTTDDGRTFPVYQLQATGRMVPCPGEAHSNPWIDNCMICAPKWGEIPEREAPLNATRLAEVLNMGMAVWCSNVARIGEQNGIVHVTQKLKGCGSTSGYAYIPSTQGLPR